MSIFFTNFFCRYFDSTVGEKTGSEVGGERGWDQERTVSRDSNLGSPEAQLRRVSGVLPTRAIDSSTNEHLVCYESLFVDDKTS